jgi:APA family basic amino acid/polyamine antiporter
MNHPESRVLGFWAAVSIVTGNMVGSGVFLLPASLAPYGGLSLVGWIVSAAGAIALALVFARLARQLPAAGGLYAYTRNAFGDVPGFLVAWGYWLSIVGTLAALAVAGVGYLDPFVPSIVRTPAAAGALAVGLVWVVIGFNVAGVGVAGRVQIVTTVLKLLPLVVVAVGGVFFVRADVFSLPATTTTPMGAQLISVVTLTLWAFLGLECATIPAGSVRDPARTIPLATITGTILAAVVYIVSTVGVMSLVGTEALAASTAPFADGARRLLGDAGARIVAIGAAISCLGALNGWTLMAAQLPMAVADDGLFPQLFARVSSKGTPVRGLIVAGVLASVLVGLNYSRGLVDLFTFIILLCTLGTLVPYVFCSLAVWLLPRQRFSGAAAAVSVFAFVYAMFAIGGAGADTVFYGFLLLMAGLPVYVWVRLASPKLHEASASSETTLKRRTTSP